MGNWRLTKALEIPDPFRIGVSKAELLEQFKDARYFRYLGELREQGEAAVSGKGSADKMRFPGSCEVSSIESAASWGSSPSRINSKPNLTTSSGRNSTSIGGNSRVIMLALCAILVLSVSACSQTTTHFEVSNPKKLQWSMDQAERIYASACELVAKSLRPEKPPRLAPKFLLVLGADQDEMLHNGTTAEIRLKSWNPARFAQAMVLMATREILKSDDLEHLTRDTLIAAGASVSVGDLKRKN